MARERGTTSAYLTLGIGSLIALLSVMPEAWTQEACSEATVGQCFPEYSAITAVTETADGFAAIGATYDGVELLRLSGNGEIAGRTNIALPSWLAQEGATPPKIEALAAGADGALLLVGWVASGPSGDQQQAGVVGLVDSAGNVSWSAPLKVSPESSVIFYSAAYDPAGKRFLVVGRHTNGADNGKCAFWSQGTIMSVPEADVTHQFPVYFVGQAVQGPENRSALYDIEPAGSEGQFVASGFATSKSASGKGCQDNAMALLVGGGMNNDWNVVGPIMIGSKDANEIAFGVASAGADRYLLTGQGGDPATGARAALIAGFGFIGAEPDLRADPFPEDGSDTTGGDRYRVLVPLKSAGSYLVAGSASASREDLNQGVWQIVSAALESPGPATYLTRKAGSDILDAALGSDGRVLAVGTHGKDGGDIGWLGLIYDQQFTAKRRQPDPGLPLLSQAEVAAGTVAMSEREIADGAGFRNNRVKAGSEFELHLSLVAETDLAVSALASEGDLDLVLADSSGKMIAYSSNLNDAGEFLHAQLQPGAYEVTVIAVSDIAEYEVRATKKGAVEDQVMTSLEALDPRSRRALSALLEGAGYGEAGNPDIALGGDTVRSVLAFYNTFQAAMQPEAVQQFVVDASVGAGK